MYKYWNKTNVLKWCKNSTNITTSKCNIVVSPTCTNIVVTNQFLLSTREIADLRMHRLCATSSYKLLHNLDCISISTQSHSVCMVINMDTNFSQINSIVYNIQRLGGVCVDTLWFQFVVGMSNGCSLLLQGTNCQWISKHAIPTCFIWATIVFNMRIINVFTLQMSNTLCMMKLNEINTPYIHCLSQRPNMTIVSMIHTYH